MTVHVLATGGTISSHWDGAAWTNIGGQALLDEIAAAGKLADDVHVVDAAAGPSSNLSLADMVAIAGRAADALDAGARGVVVVHGTDTLELTAFATQLVLGTSPSRRPVVFTGSMRVHSHPAPDGPRNVRDAVAAAASGASAGREVMVCMEGLLHAADRVRKADAASLDAFTSAPLGPVGSVSGMAVDYLQPADGRRPLGRIDVAALAHVPLVSCAAGGDTAGIAAALATAPAAVIEGFGDLNLPQSVWQPVHEAAARGCTVIVASRAFTTSISTDTLDALGAIGAGGLTAQKAHVAATLALAAGCDGAALARLVREYALRRNAGERSSA